jgi:hypothetical protein
MRRRASSAHPVVASARRFEASRLVRFILYLVAGFAVLYLVTANIVLRTRLLRDLVSRGDDVELDYASAYSVWPGLVHVRGLALRVQDYHNQLSVSADSGIVQVCLHDLLFRRFHASDVALSGLAFRFRQKVEPRDGMQPHVAAFPPIAGFPDPPVLSGERPPPLTDAEYDLWQIAIDKVDAELRELWILEYRYLGLGSVHGGFRLLPARHFAVYPAAVQLKRGTLSIGDEVAAGRLELELEGHVEATDVRQGARGRARREDDGAPASEHRRDRARRARRARRQRSKMADRRCSPTGRERVDDAGPARRGRLGRARRAQARDARSVRQARG